MQYVTITSSHSRKWAADLRLHSAIGHGCLGVNTRNRVGGCGPHPIQCLLCGVPQPTAYKMWAKKLGPELQKDDKDVNLKGVWGDLDDGVCISSVHQ